MKMKEKSLGLIVCEIKVIIEVVCLWQDNDSLLIFSIFTMDSKKFLKVCILAINST